MGTGRIVDTWHKKDKTPSTRFGIGQRWQGVWSDGKGGETKRSFQTKDAAKTWIDTQIYETMRNPYALRRDVSFAAYWELWRSKQTHQRKASLKSIDAQGKKWILPAFRGMTMQQITREDVQAAVNVWALELAPSTVELTMRYLRGVFNDAVYSKQVNESPCVRIRMPERVQAVGIELTDDVLGELVEALPAPFDDAARICAATGLRPGELIGLSKRDINFKAGRIQLREQDTSTSTANITRGPLKTRYSTRNISFGPKLASILQRLCDGAGRSGRLFQIDGQPLIRHHFQAAWNTARAELGNIGPGWHQLRHYHASVLISRGFSPVAVASRLGHKDANETLRTYSHMWFDEDDRLAEAAESII
ncbi:tyrosine-type recombinase/integrase [Glutamicibacter mysorens]